jgi:hypothetical protein
MAFACAVVGYMAPMTTSNVRSGTSRSGTNADTHRANPLGAYIATLGALILLASVWLDWVGLGIADSETNSSSGYEADSLIPFMGLLGLGFALALLYATKRADRRQHRGLSLASFAVGLASLLWIVFFIIDPIETVKYAGYDGESEPNVTTELGDPRPPRPAHPARPGDRDPAGQRDRSRRRRPPPDQHPHRR